MSAIADIPEPEEQLDPAQDVDELTAALDGLSAAVDRFQGLDLTRFSDQRIEDGLRRFVAESRRLPGVRNALVAEVVDRCLPMVRRAGSTAMYLRSLVRVSIGTGRAWERDSHDLAPRRALSSGELLPPLLPLVAAAVDAGAISTAHARAITDTLRRAPATVGSADRALAEARLVRFAQRHDPSALSKRCAEVLDELDPDGSLGSTPAERERARSFILGKQDKHGMYPVRGRLDPECGAMLSAALSPLAGPQPAPDGAPDLRSAEQRHHDALGELARRSLAAGDLPVKHGLPAKLLLTARLEQIEERTGVVSTAHGGRLPVRDLLRLAAETGVIPVVFDSDGQVLHFGEEQRLGTVNQRLAIYLLDGGCTFEGCSVPAVWCQCAHGEPFRTSKQTTVADLALLCGWHHRRVDTEEWTIRRIKNRVWLTPPKWIDPDQVPRTNEHFRPLRE